MARSSRYSFTVGPSISPAYIRSQLFSWTDSDDYAFLLGLLYGQENVLPHQDISRGYADTSSDAPISDQIFSYAIGAQGIGVSEPAVPSTGTAPSLHVTKALEAMSSGQTPAATTVTATCQSLIETARLVAFEKGAPPPDLYQVGMVAGGIGMYPLSDGAIRSASHAAGMPCSNVGIQSPGGDAWFQGCVAEERENALLVLQGVENWLLVDMYVSEDEGEHAHLKQELQLKFLRSLGYDVTDLVIEAIAGDLEMKAADTEQLVVLADLNDDTATVAVEDDAPLAPDHMKKTAALNSLEQEGEPLHQKKKDSQDVKLGDTAGQTAELSQAASRIPIAKKKESVLIGSRYGAALRRESLTSQRKQGKQHRHSCASSPSRWEVHRTGKGETLRSQRKRRSVHKRSRYTQVSARCSSKRSSASDNTSDSTRTSSRRSSVTTRSSSRRSSTSDNLRIDPDMFVIVPV